MSEFQYFCNGEQTMLLDMYITELKYKLPLPEKDPEREIERVSRINSTQSKSSVRTMFHLNRRIIN